MRDLAVLGEHLWQQPEHSKSTSERMKVSMKGLVARGEHPWQQPEHSKNASEQMRGLAARGEHWFQQREYSKSASVLLSEHNKVLAAIGEHPIQKQLDNIYLKSKPTA